MERIILEVDGAIARAWRNTPPSKRIDYEEKINAVLRDLKEAEFDRLLDEAGRIAAANGLTEDKLNALLSEEN